jgi:hypothetical protein
LLSDHPTIQANAEVFRLLDFAVFCPNALHLCSVHTGFYKTVVSIGRLGPAVIGSLVVALLRMVPTAAPDYFTAALLVLTVAMLMLRSVGPFPLVLGGAVIGALRRTLHWE